jgi:hypothetical protein
MFWKQLLICSCQVAFHLHWILFIFCESVFSSFSFRLWATSYYNTHLVLYFIQVWKVPELNCRTSHFPELYFMVPIFAVSLSHHNSKYSSFSLSNKLCWSCSMMFRIVTHPWWWRQYAPLKRRSTIILHGSTSHKTILNIILAAVRTWDLTKL